MEWLIVFGLCCLTGLARFLDGAGHGENPWAAKIPAFVFHAVIAGAVGAVGFIASGSLIASVVVGGCSAGTIAYGGTNWTSIKDQSLRGAGPCALMLLSLILLDWQLSKPAILIMLGLHTTGYAVYFGIDKIKTPIGHWEQFCRVLQGSLICFAAYFVGG